MTKTLALVIILCLYSTVLAEHGNQLRISNNPKWPQILRLRSTLKRPWLTQCKVDFYSYLNPQKALLIDGRGRLDEVSCFENDSNAEVHRSCSLTWHNGFYVFGGRSNKRQISQVKGTRLTSIGTLTFDHYIATCDVMAGEKIFLCFNFHSNDSKRCRLALSPLAKFSQIQQSKHHHRSASIAASDCK